ncbi:MAG: ribonuclease III [Bacteroidota bacterium]
MWQRITSLFLKREASPSSYSSHTASHSPRIKELERIIEISIDDPSLFEKALRHRSSLGAEKYRSYDSYERLEFLGDSVLDLITAEILFERYPEKDEGFLTKLRAKLVRGETLSSFSRQLDFDRLMEMGERSDQVTISKGMLADVFESVIAAIYITKGYDEAFGFVERVFDRLVDFKKMEETSDNYKSVLLEYTQATRRSLPRYELISESGPGHNKTFEVRVLIDGSEWGTGVGKSKKKAEQEAAQEALKHIA